MDSPFFDLKSMYLCDVGANTYYGGDKFLIHIIT